MQSELPSGTVTFLFTDVEGSTKLLHEFGAEQYAQALGEHRRILRQAFGAYGGVEVDTQGDAFFVAFPTAPGALEAAGDALEGLAAGPIRVRMGIHTGTPHLGDEGYVGVDVHRAARIAACGHGGQVLVSVSTAALTGTEGLRDLGEHRLKDLSAPERIYQLGEGEFPALKSLYRTNLPIPATAFLGRETELAEVGALLAREDVRLLTLTGPGGTGKTRLALQATAEASDAYPDGVYWVPLAPLRDSELVLEEASEAVGAQDGLAEHIAGKQLLLLFDNFEQVVEAAGGLAELLAACPNLQLVVTSRELLQLPGEQAYPVPPLAEKDGVELFTVRVRASLPGFAASPVVGELCERLDNLPLALELAAARVRVLSPEQLLERLSGRLDLLKAGRGVDPRQQTLRATIAWSHELLSAEEQELFARLSVFRGGCTLEAAEEICGADLDTLQSLVDKSLVRHTEGRFWMLETIREYAAERLGGSGEAEDLGRRHAEHFLALAEEAEPHAASDPVWIRRLDAEDDNFRAALDGSEASGELALALRLAGALGPFWDGGHVAEGRHRLERLLSRDEHPSVSRAKALAGAAVLARQSGDAATAKRRAEEALALSRDLGDAPGTAEATVILGLAFADEGDFSRARDLFENGVELFHGVGDELNALFASRVLAWMYEELGDRERAWALYEHNLSWARALGNKPMEAQTLGAVAAMVLDQGRTDDAVSIMKDVLRIDRDIGMRSQTSLDLTRFARALAFAGGADPEAAALMSCAEAIREEIGAGGMPFLVRAHEEAVAALRTRLDGAAFAEAWEQGRKLTADEAVALALGEVERDA